MVDGKCRPEVWFWIILAAVVNLLHLWLLHPRLMYLQVQHTSSKEIKRVFHFNLLICKRRIFFRTSSLQQDHSVLIFIRHFNLSWIYHWRFCFAKTIWKWTMFLSSKKSFFILMSKVWNFANWPALNGKCFLTKKFGELPQLEKFFKTNLCQIGGTNTLLKLVGSI